MIDIDPDDPALHPNAPRKPLPSEVRDGEIAVLSDGLVPPEASVPNRERRVALMYLTREELSRVMAVVGISLLAVKDYENILCKVASPDLKPVDIGAEIPTVVLEDFLPLQSGRLRGPVIDPKQKNS